MAFVAMAELATQPRAIIPSDTASTGVPAGLPRAETAKLLTPSRLIVGLVEKPVKFDADGPHGRALSSSAAAWLVRKTVAPA